MTEDSTPRKVPLIFFRSGRGAEPVREWLKGLPEADRQAVGKISYGRNGAGQSECLYAGRWATGFGKSAPICRQNARRA